ncbi:unnamed protein product [Meloidogyne enterolobii]|uniref:Uncharacterized protein n=1 Tax=Meloidogyne enterolobii TaxID=390850 RepID=A0ACB0Z646_MELEN
MSNDCENICITIDGEDEEEDTRFKLIPFEQNLMVENFISDVLYIMASGLALERLFFAHLHLYSDQRHTYLIINTTPEDEHFYLEKLKALNPDSPPKLITADVLAKDRVIIYKSGGVQFVTSRILMVDLLAGRVPFDKVAGILVYRAHDVLHGFKESFILRLFREKKKDGIVKAFTDRPLYIVSTGVIGQLQRLLNLLYVRKVVIVPRFHEEPKLTQMSIKLQPLQRKTQSTLHDIIATCVRELKQSTKGFDPETLSDTLAPYATLYPTKLEIELRKNDVEDLDPTNAMNFISWLRNDEETIKNNSGWLFTKSAATLFSSIDDLCSLHDNEGNRTITAPSKWSVFCNLIKEITDKLKTENSDSPLLVLVSNESLSRQLIDLMAPSRRDSFSMAPPIEPLWNPANIACYDEQIFEKKLPLIREVVPEGMLPEDPFTSFYEHEKDEKSKEEKQKVEDEQQKNSQNSIICLEEDEEGASTSHYSPPLPPTPEDPHRSSRLPLRRFQNDDNFEQPQNDVDWQIKQLDPPLDKSIASIHIIDEFNRTQEEQNLAENKKDDQNEQTKIQNNQINKQNSMLIFLEVGSRYQLLNCLETLKPLYIIMYSQDMAATRTFKCLNEDHPLELYVLMYEDSYEEERYLSSLQRENEAIETLIKEQSLLLAPREFDVSRDSTSQLRRLTTPQRRDTRYQRSGSSKASQMFLCEDEEEENMENRQKVIVDLREFNSELPTVLYRRGIDLMAAMLEVGDYILSPDICCERKSPDDLTQSLLSGRIFKQVEQMKKCYKYYILLIESAEKYRNKNNPFQGEMSRYSRNVRSLFAILIREYPNLQVLWSVSPSHSAELFEELKVYFILFFL